MNPLVEHIYAHVPFCPRVCPYCSFYVEPADRRKIAPLVGALLREIEVRRSQFNLRARTIFLGGGTPSALPTTDLLRLCHALAGLGPIDEFTLELNPTTVSLEKARALVESGVTRASLGAQSFDPDELKILGRQHTPERIVRSFEILREAGLGQVNIDLMFALPGQSIESWLATLHRAVALAPDHISAYCLTYEEDTPFFEKIKRGEWAADCEKEAAFFERTAATLEAAGYLQYEVSNFARPGCESQHNLAYWRGRDYLGFGPSAVSTVGDRRWKNVPDLSRYIEGAESGVWHEVEQEAIDGDLRARERWIFGLRTREGVEDDVRFGEILEMLEREGLAQRRQGRWSLTRAGLMRADAIGELFVR